MNCSNDIKADLTKLLVPIERWVAVTAGRVGAECLDEADRCGYDDLPLLEEGRVIGFVPLTRLHELARANESISGKDPELKSSFIAQIGPIDHVLATLGSHRIAGVVGPQRAVVGIVTISDLNRHGFRAILYPVLAQLEEQIAKLIDAEFEDPWEWITKVGDSRVSIVGHWECLKKDGLDVSATARATLGQMLKVVEDTASLVSRCSLSRAKLSTFKSRALRYRNAVMHPTRPLVTSQKDVISLRAFMADLSRLSDALR